MLLELYARYFIKKGMYLNDNDLLIIRVITDDQLLLVLDARSLSEKV